MNQTYDKKAYNSVLIKLILKTQREAMKKASSIENIKPEDKASIDAMLAGDGYY